MKKVICLVIGMMLVLSCSLSHAEMKAWSTMKNFKVKTMEGQTFNLYQELETKELVLIDLWYAECGVCTYTAGSLQMVYQEYEDRVGFISLNPFDSQKTVARYTQGRGLTFPCARYTSARSWAQWYPWFILVGKNGQVLYSNTGCTDPDAVRNLLDWGLSLSEADYQRLAAEGTEYYPTGSNDYKTQAELNCYAFIYNMMDNMSLEVNGPDVRRIVVDDNLKIVQCNTLCGEFYIAPRGTALEVTVTTDHSVNPGKAYMCNFLYFEDKTFFKKAKNGKNRYTFEVVTDTSPDGRLFAASGDFGSTTLDSHIGFLCFFDESEAERYFCNLETQYGVSIPWHVE